MLLSPYPTESHQDPYTAVDNREWDHSESVLLPYRFWYPRHIIHIYGWSYMGTHMKTTVDINDSLLIQVKQVASKRQQTFKSVLEAALRQFLEADTKESTPFRLRKHSFKGRGLQPNVTEGNWSDLREKIYEGRGG